MFGIGAHMPIRKDYWYSTGDSRELRYQLPGTARDLTGGNP